MNNSIQKYASYLLAILGFIVISLVYFSPVLQGKKIYQSDIAQYIGTAKQQIDFRKNNDEELYWNDRVFGGMPTYQLGAKYPHNYIKKIDLALRFLPRPADYLFLYFVGFFILLLSLKINPLLAFVGSLAFGFSTYFIIIIGVGHNAKAHAIGYMPLVLSGVLLVFKHKYVKGGLLFCIAMALELVANHYQMTYYFFLLLLVIGITYFVKAFKQQQLPKFGKAVGILISGLVLAIALNATSIMATKEYSSFSTRGKSELSISPEGTSKDNRNGLDKEYILQYSYGFLETFNLLVPRLMGGSSSEDAGKDAAIIKELVKLGYPYKEAKNVAKNSPTYWGDQPIVGAPAYIGASILFLFFLGIFLIDNYKKWWIVIGSLLALFLSYGKNIEWLSSLFINYFPLYNKFRAVTSIQVIIELCVPLFGIYTLHNFFNNHYTVQKKTFALYKATGLLGGLLLIFIVFRNVIFSFAGPNDPSLIESAGINFVSALRQDRARMLTSDSIRSLIFVLTMAGVLWAWLQNKLKITLCTLLIGIVLCTDLVPVARRYVNTEGFVNANKVNKPFKVNTIDQKILEDKSRFRVYDLSQGNPMNTARTSYFHNSVGGYHGAKPKRIQELFDFYMAKGEQSILNMLNVKYFIFNSKEGLKLSPNKDTFGNAWFVNSVKKATDANNEILSLKGIDLSKNAITSANSKLTASTFITDSLATIKLISEHPQKLIYKTSNQNAGFAVFSEMYYKNGWKAYLDNEEVPIIKTNYALRGLEVPSGKHQIKFSFTPTIVQIGSKISLFASILTLLLLVGAIVISIKNKKFIT